jgi:arylsulfatase A-like enzyme
VHEQLGPAVAWQLSAFVAAAWLTHAIFGLAAFGLARLTERALPPGVAVRRVWLVAGWFVFLTGLVFAANTTWFTSSQFAGDDSAWRRPWFGQPRVVWLLITLAAIIALLVWRAWPQVRRQARTVAVASAILAASVAVVLLAPIGPAGAEPTDHPHIVFVGIDSLRSDLSLPKHGTAEAPAIRAFLQGARRFDDVTSPLPRTFGSWVSIFSGRHPVTTNARVNLMPRGLVHEGATLPKALHAEGYATVYATDETRFANFDASYGFDRLITPPVGAADFLLGYGGDMPVVNLVAGTPLGRVLFPFNHANRGAYVTYRPSQFARRLDREVVIDGPTFLTIHLTLAHWPYAWAGTTVPSQPAQYRAAYASAVAEVDRQFGVVMHLLADKGALDNAIVVLLSDHGEALGGEDDSMLRGTGTSREIWDSLWGHGTSVMSPRQYQVLLAIRAFGRARLPGPQQNHDWPVTLEDLRPTIEELATGRAPAGVDGVSLVPYMAKPERASALATRIRFTETDFNTPRTLAGRYEVSGIVDEAAVFYEIDPDSGWVQFRPDRLPELMAQKQRAAFSPEALLAALPGAPGGPPRYLYIPRKDPKPRALSAPPDPQLDPEARRLWAALQARFPGELGPVSSLP